MDILFKKNNLVPSAIRDGEAELVFEVVNLFAFLEQCVHEQINLPRESSFFDFLIAAGVYLVVYTGKPLSTPEHVDLIYSSLLELGRSSLPIQLECEYSLQENNLFRVLLELVSMSSVLPFTPLFNLKKD
jgi:hypothetical protein